jgi:hypothetical protein
MICGVIGEATEERSGAERSGYKRCGGTGHRRRAVYFESKSCFGGRFVGYLLTRIGRSFLQPRVVSFATEPWINFDDGALN